MIKENQPMDVCLVMPPIAYSRWASFALSLLKGALNEAGISSYVDYANVYYDCALGEDYVHEINQGNMTDFLQEYVFTGPAGITPIKGIDELEKCIAKTLNPIETVDKLKVIKHAEEIAFSETEKTVERLLKHNPKIVAVSSCFTQRNAAIAICKRVKEVRPEVVTMMGGANCFGRAGLGILRKFPFVDYVFFGESDDIFADVCRIAMEKKNDPLPYGVLRNGEPLPSEAPHRIVMDLDSIAYPDYDDFVEMMSTETALKSGAYEGISYDMKSGISLLLESSRGCWWGEKCPCTFCGLNGIIKTYRRKSPKRLFEEVKYITEKYKIYRIVFSDCVLPYEWVTEIAPLFKNYDKKMEFFGEVRSTLTDEDMKKLSEANVKFMQPGIESLSNHELQLMHKGVSALQNLSFMKSAIRHGISITWNNIVGFPGETINDYYDQMKLFPFIEHLSPPNSCECLIYARDNEYLCHGERYGLTYTPDELYEYEAPDDREYIEDIAIYYKSSVPYDNPEFLRAKQKLKSMVMEWKDKFYGVAIRPRLDMVDSGENILIIDTRTCKNIRAQLLIGAEAEVYRLCYNAVSLKYIYENLSGSYSSDEIKDALQGLMAKKLIIKYGDMILGLAVKFSMDELKTREVRDFVKRRTISRSFRTKLHDALAEESKKGLSNRDATVKVVTELAHAMNMCFTGEDYINYNPF